MLSYLQIKEYNFYKVFESRKKVLNLQQFFYCNWEASSYTNFYRVSTKKCTFKILRAIMGGRNFGPKWPKVVQSGPKWPKVAQSGPKWPKVAQTLRENLDGPKWPKIPASHHSPQNFKSTFFLGHPVGVCCRGRGAWVGPAFKFIQGYCDACGSRYWCSFHIFPLLFNCLEIFTKSVPTLVTKKLFKCIRREIYIAAIVQ